MPAIRKFYRIKGIVQMIIGLWILSFFFVSCDRDPDDIAFSEDNIFNIASYIELNKEEYSRFYEIMVLGDLSNALQAYNPFGNGFTLFLPTDEAFDRFIQNSESYASFDELLADMDFVRLIGRYHLVNSMILSNDFPYGALSDTTASGDYLTIGFSSDFDSTVYKVNNLAPILIPNLEMENGYIHVIGELLEPVRFTAYEWLKQKSGYSILSEALDVTGLSDTLGLYITTESGKEIRNSYSLLVEHDSIFARYGIHSINDLIDKYTSPGKELNDKDNGVYQFAAYHILEGSYFLDEFSASAQNYNSYANFPVSISSGIEIRINPGVDTFGYVITGLDTTAINYIRMYYQESNVLTKSGPVHMLTDVMELYKPSRSQRTFQFLEEPAIKEARTEPDTYEFIDPENFEVLNWTGVDKLIYYRAAGNEPASMNDYLKLDGDFIIEYIMPKILPGKYNLSIRMDADNNNNATIQVYLDGKSIGSNYDLTSGASGNSPYVSYVVGTVDFSAYKEHTIKIRSLIPGIMIWDYVRFDPL